jgi:hypothetical protein
VATPSTTGAITVAVGSSAAFNVTFTTDDGEGAINLSITTGLSALPVGSGSVTFNYSYTNNAGTTKTGTATVSYAATSIYNNNVVATPSPAGQIAAAVGGTGTVGSLSACTQATLIGTAVPGNNIPSPRSTSVYGGNLYVGTSAGPLILPIANDGTVTVHYPCSPTIGTLCTIEASGLLDNCNNNPNASPQDFYVGIAVH